MKTAQSTLWDGTPALPPVGCLVLIYHGSDTLDRICEVTGYEVKPHLEGDKTYHRVFVNVKYINTLGVNQRLLKDVRPLTKARSIAQPGDKAAS